MGPFGPIQAQRFARLERQDGFKASSDIKDYAVKEEGLVLQDCTASSLDEMRPHRMGGRNDGWAARSRDLLVRNESCYAGPSKSADSDGRFVGLENGFESSRRGRLWKAPLGAALWLLF